jgi:hypothetical protein
MQTEGANPTPEITEIESRLVNGKGPRTHSVVCRSLQLSMRRILRDGELGGDVKSNAVMLSMSHLYTPNGHVSSYVMIDALMPGTTKMWY